MTAPVTEPNLGGWFQTYTGVQFFPVSPEPGSIRIRDIAHALAQMPRFTGHTQRFYSVAQHSVLAASLVPESDRLWALLHDASEAYLCDIAKPLKMMPEFAGYRVIEAHLQTMIFSTFGLTGPEPASVKLADRTMLATEASQLLGPLLPAWHANGGTDFTLALDIQIDPWTPEAAEFYFLQTFNALTRG